MLDPKNVDYLRHLGTAQTLAGKREDAIATYRQLLLQKPKDYDGLMALAINLSVTGRFDDAIISAKAALEVKPNAEKTVYFIALNYIDKGDKETAASYLPRLKELDEDLAKKLEKALGTQPANQKP